MSRISKAAAAAFPLAASLAPGALWAQQETMLEPLVIEGGLTPIAASDYGRAYSVVDEQTLEDKQIVYAVDALRALPGVAISRTGGYGGSTSVRLRGAEGNHTLVLIDGIEVSSTEGGEYDFGGLLAADIARIEVLRGPQSSLFGANALGGVILITTKRASEPGLHWSGLAEAGTDGTGALQAALRGGFERGAFSVSAARRETEGFDISNTPGGEDDGDINLTLNANGEIYATDWLTLGGTLRLVDRHSDTDGFQWAAPTRDGLVFDDASAHDRREIFGAAYAQAELGRVESELRVAYSHADDQSTLSGADVSDTTGTRLSLKAQGTVALDAATVAAADHTLTGLLEYKRETYVNNDPALVSNPSMLDEQSREMVGLAAEYRGHLFNLLDLQLGLRQDFNDAFDDATTWSAGASAPVGSWGTRVHASAGTGVQNPTLYDQFGFIPGQWIGNPNLKPEKSFGWDFGVEQTLLDDRLVVDVTYFKQDLEDEIGTTYAPPLFYGTPINLTGRSERQGIEIASTLHATDWLTLQATYTWLDAEDPSGEVEVRRPEHELGASATIRFLGGRARATLDGRYVAGNHDLDYTAASQGANRVRLDDYVVVNLSAAYAVSDNAEVFGRVNNLFDADYEEVHGYATPGLAAYAGVRVNF